MVKRIPWDTESFFFFFFLSVMESLSKREREKAAVSPCLYRIQIATFCDSDIRGKIPGNFLIILILGSGPQIMASFKLSRIAKVPWFQLLHHSRLSQAGLNGRSSSCGISQTSSKDGEPTDCRFAALPTL